MQMGTSVKIYRNFETKHVDFEISHNAEIVNGGPFGLFETPVCCKISKKIKRGPFGEKNFRKKSLTLPKKTNGVRIFYTSVFSPYPLRFVNFISIYFLLFASTWVLSFFA